MFFLLVVFVHYLVVETRSVLIPSNFHPVDSLRPSSINCTWLYITQKLDHFGTSNDTYNERYCLYDKFWKKGSEVGFDTEEQAPIFFYTGNESPLEVYINNTGLMWQLGEQMGALLVFAEHRYEGLSVPVMDGLKDCLSYGTSAQALQDYVVLIKNLKEKYKTEAPVVAFGGSYGGMLAGWFRMKYPDVIAGSIAASAPVAAFPSIMERSGLDAGFAALSRGATSRGGATDKCYENLRTAWPLILEVGKSGIADKILSDAASFCSVVSASQIVSFGQSPWFNLAEGNYPFPSTYITVAVGPGDYPLPAWPMRVACEKGLNDDLGIKVEGSLEDVKYVLRLGEIEVNVDWDHTSGNGHTLTEKQILDSGIVQLVKVITDAVGVWANVSGQVLCYSNDQSREVGDEGLKRFPKSFLSSPVVPDKQRGVKRSQISNRFQFDSEVDAFCPACSDCPPCPLSFKEEPRACSWKNNYPLDESFAWDLVVCNEWLNIGSNSVSGVGRDLFWPPTVPDRNYTVQSVFGPDVTTDGGCSSSYDMMGLFGTPTKTNSYSDWIVAYYDQKHVTTHSNIVWSNGALDPWSGAGVYAPGSGGALGPMAQKLNPEGSSLALVIDLGAHHLDLFFSTPQDPPSVVEVRKIEASKIREWSQQYYDTHKKLR
eukprot:TRINITY_DN11683_c0_g2_i1.p1 TRINITY_DN11683_c0_g2~~TRINITY_DN11683_c0_g2_i1.p1  ORF type:complete len:655 (+),score=116.82 TRINITY_DN11683_c0_g2_i1:123-2087(+)